MNRLHLAVKQHDHPAFCWAHGNAAPSTKNVFSCGSTNQNLENKHTVHGVLSGKIQTRTHLFLQSNMLVQKSPKTTSWNVDHLGLPFYSA